MIVVPHGCCVLLLPRKHFMASFLGVFISLASLGGAAADNLPPTAVAATLSTKEDTPKSVLLKGVDPEKQKLTFSIVSPPAHGKLVLKRGVAVYTPDANYFSPEGVPDSFTFKANDGQLDSSPATVTITVQASNDKPLAQGGQVFAVRNTARDISLSGSDVDGDALTYKPDNKSKKGGTVVLKGGNVVTYTPKAGFLGKDDFNFTVWDGKLLSKPGKMAVVVRAENTAPLANAGGDFTVAEKATVLLDGSASSDEDGNIVSYVWEQIVGTPAVLQDATSATPTVALPDVAADENLTFTLVVRDNNGAVGEDAVVVTVNATDAPPTATGKLNDTGITQCADATSNGLACPQAGFLGQDAETGRDASQLTDNDADGHRGFSFTKISSTGAELPAEASEWSCVKDNVTGLIWEVKTDDGGLHDKDWTYTWYEPDNSKNGGNAGTQNGGVCGGTSPCDTDSYVQAIKTAGGWCGANDWRMPTVDELSGIARLDRYQYPATDAPAIDTSYFPNTTSTVAEYGEYAVFWSASPSAGNGDGAWGVGFNGGYGGWVSKGYAFQVRLVRSGQ